MENNTCQVCGVDIKTQIFRNTGVCCDIHRKVLRGEMTLEEADRAGSRITK